MKTQNGVTFAKGFVASGIKAGIKKSGNLDMAMIYSEKVANVAGVFTQNKVAAAPVKVSQNVVKHGKAHAVIVNAGCANACTGEKGLDDANQMAKLTAEILNCNQNEVIVGSTGVIGQNLPMDKIAAGIVLAKENLSEDGSESASQAIITTDTFAKVCTKQFFLGETEIRLGAMAKGSGMICPNMATMLCFITTDVCISQKLLQKALSEIVEVTFNMISVDGDMSTNDTVVVLANGAANNALIAEENEDYQKFYNALKEMCTELAEKIATDGEGATKFLKIKVSGAKTFADAKQVAMSVAKSPLVKTAFFGQDPNWGRVICAVGYSGVDIIPEKTVVAFGDVVVYKNGLGEAFDEKKLQAVMEAHDIEINIELNLGDVSALVWSCDFSYDYVKINGEYHT